MIDNKSLSLSFQPVRLLRIVERVKEELRQALEERRLEFEIAEFETSEDVVIADPQRLLQVFRQVIINAVKYTPDAGQITIASRRRPGFVEVRVSDTGIGIAPENQQHIFEKFSSAGDSSLHSTSKTKFKGGGAGLGLAIVKGIIEAHGGTIWCESPGHDERACPGSTFHIMIPILPPVPEANLFLEALRPNSL
jgi:signal transduction histidine kinase